MTERTVRLGGFRITVEVPHKVISAVRRAATRVTPAATTSGADPAGPLVVKPAPVVAVERRDLEAGVSFIRVRRQWRADHAREALPGEIENSPEALAREVAGHPWYHTIELPHGIVTQGVYDHRALVPHYGLPDDLNGKRVLDVASADGFWAFELERRGGDVTAFDIASTDEVDLPAPVRRKASQEGLVDPTAAGFALASRALGSKARHVTGTIYDLDPERLGRFDLVHAGDILLHLRDPFAALEQIRAVTAGEALLSDVFDPALPAGPAGQGGLTRHFGGTNGQWWTPALSTLAQMVADAGFSDVKVLTTYNLAGRGQTTGPWRAVLRARP